MKRTAYLVLVLLGVVWLNLSAASDVFAEPKSSAKAEAKVEIIDFSVEPSQPQSGEQVKVKLTVKNTGQSAVPAVQWGIFYLTGNQSVGSGNQHHVAPGNSFTSTAIWTAKAGRQELIGHIGSKAATDYSHTAATKKTITLNIPERRVGPGTSGAAPSSAGTSTEIRKRDVEKAGMRDKGLNDAKKDYSSAKENIKDVNMGQEQRPQEGSLREVGAQQPGHGKQTPLKEVGQGHDGGAHKKPIFVGEDVIKGARYGDTFQGNRINSQHGTQTVDGVKGSSAGNSGGGTAGGGSGGGHSGSGGHSSSSGGSKSGGSDSLGASRSSLPGGSSSAGGGGGGGGSEGRGGSSGGGSGRKTSADIDFMLRAEGGTPTGDADKDEAELAWAQSVGGRYEETKNMSASERAAWLTAEAHKQGMGSDEKPVESKDYGSSGGPMRKGIKGKAGGGDDPRQDDTGKGGSGGGVGVVIGKDDKAVRSQDAGKVNYDKMLEINEVINPQRK